MPKVFVSYARADQEMVQALIRELQELGYDAFYDQNLTGGQRWWDVLLDQIQAADGFLPVLTSEYRQSEACHREAVWAESLDIPFVPIDLGQASPDLFEKVVAEANWVRYSLDDRASVARLARALGAMSKPEPPSPLPPRPAIPISYFAELEREIRTSPTIPLDRQFAIIATLRAKLSTREDASARIMLSELRNRTDITYSNAVDIERMLSTPASEQLAPQQQQQAPPAEPRHHRHHGEHVQPPPPPPPQTAAYQQTGYQQRADPSGTSYGQTGYQAGGYQHGGFQAAAPLQPDVHQRAPYVQGGSKQYGAQQSQRSTGSPPPTRAIVQYGLFGLGALLVILALLAVDWISFSNGNTADYGRIHDLIGTRDVGLAVAYFKWLGYLLTVLALVMIAICVFVPRRPKVLVQITVGVVLVQVVITIAATVSEVNRVQDQLGPQGISTSYDAGLWLMLFGMVIATVGALIPRRTQPRRSESPRTVSPGKRP
jgi:hypothetical protein